MQIEDTAVNGVSVPSKFSIRGIQMLTDYKPHSCTFTSASPSLPDELNSFYACFELVNPHLPERAPSAMHNVTSTIPVVDVKKSFDRVNTCKAISPNGISGRVLKVCSKLLLAVFT